MPIIFLMVLASSLKVALGVEMKLLMTQEPADNMSETKETLARYGIDLNCCSKDGEEVISRVETDRPDVTVCGANPATLEVFKVTGFDNVLNIR